MILLDQRSNSKGSKREGTCDIVCHAHGCACQYQIALVHEEQPHTNALLVCPQTQWVEHVHFCVAACRVHICQVTLGAPGLSALLPAAAYAPRHQIDALPAACMFADRVQQPWVTAAYCSNTMDKLVGLSLLAACNAPSDYPVARLGSQLALNSPNAASGY